MMDRNEILDLITKTIADTTLLTSTVDKIDTLVNPEKHHSKEEILKKHLEELDEGWIDWENGVIDSCYHIPQILKAMEEYSSREAQAEKETIKQWLIDEDFEGLAERI